MFHDKWHKNVTLPLGAAWGNGLGGVAACMVWTASDSSKNPLGKSKVNATRQGYRWVFQFEIIIKLNVLSSYLFPFNLNVIGLRLIPALKGFKPYIIQFNIFLPTWSCVSLPRSTTSSEWKLLTFINARWMKCYTNLANVKIDFPFKFNCLEDKWKWWKRL